MVIKGGYTVTTKQKFSGDQLFNIAIYIIAIFIIAIILYPLIFVVSASFSDPTKILNGEVWLLPKGFTLDAYRQVFQDSRLWNSYKNTIVYTIIGTTINIILTTLLAYPLSRKDLPGRNFFMFVIAFTMFFSGGIVPTYLVVQDLGMLDTIWALVIPGATRQYWDGSRISRNTLLRTTSVA